MALSNIFREPRREIVETVVGAAIVLPLIYADYQFGLWFQARNSSQETAHLVFGMIVGLFGLAIAGVILTGIHALGDAVCNRLQERVIHLRPKQRVRR